MMTSANPVKVLYCESNIDGTIGGSHYCLLHIVENLDRSLFEPIVMFYENHALVPTFQKVSETIVREPYRPVQWGASGGQGLWSLPLVLVRRAVNFVKFIGAVVEHVRFLKRNRIALVHQNNSITRHREWMCAAFLAGVPCVASERGLNARYTALDRAYARSLALIIPMSRWIMDHMVQRGVSPANIRVLYDGIDPDTLRVEQSSQALRHAYGIGTNQPVIGIVGNIREWKGQETVVRALIEVVKVHPDVVCFFVGAAAAGDQSYLDRLHTLIRETGIESNVRFTGYQRNPASFVNMMGVVIHASVQPEPFGMVVLEAMAQRKPVIGSRAGGVMEMVVEGETGYTFPPGDSDLLSKYIIELLSNPNKARQMGEKGYKRLTSSFTLPRYMDDIHAVYRAILSKCPLASNVGLSHTVNPHAAR